MMSEQRSYIDLNHTQFHSNIDFTNHKRVINMVRGAKGSSDKKSALPLSPLTRHITD